MAVLHKDSLQPDGLHGDSLRGDQGCALGFRHRQDRYRRRSHGETSVLPKKRVPIHSVCNRLFFKSTFMLAFHFSAEIRKKALVRILIKTDVISLGAKFFGNPVPGLSIQILHTPPGQGISTSCSHTLLICQGLPLTLVPVLN